MPQNKENAQGTINVWQMLLLPFLIAGFFVGFVCLLVWLGLFVLFLYILF